MELHSNYVLIGVFLIGVFLGTGLGVCIACLDKYK